MSDDKPVPSPIEAVAPLLRQVQQLGYNRVLASAWHYGYVAALKDFASGRDEPTPNPFEAAPAAVPTPPTP